MLIAATAFFLGLQAQSAPPSGQADIVVTGERKTEREAVRAYVNDISRPVGGQLPTFRYPVCPRVVGLPAEYSAIIEDRIRTVAAGAGMRVEQESCAPNLTFVVVSSSEDFVEQLHEEHPEFFAGLERNDMKRLVGTEGPARAWSVVQLLNEDGGSAAGKIIRVRTSSIFKPSTQMAVLASFVAIDAAALVGKNLTQVADYVAMRGLAGAEPPRGSTPRDTILTLFNPDASPASSLSAADLAYMAALQRVPLQKLGFQRQRLSNAVRDAASE